FVGIEVKSQVQRQRGVKDADRILSGDLSEFLDLVVARVVDRYRVRLAHAIEDYDQTFIPSRRVVGAGSVRQVMVDMMNLVRCNCGQVLVYLRKEFFAREDFLVLLRGSRVEHERGFVWRVVKAM